MPSPIRAYDPAKVVWRFTLTSDCQHGPNPVEVLLPDSFSSSSVYRTLYVLPVEVGLGGVFGDGLALIRQANLHNRHNLICVTPAFDTIPWYAAHSSDPAIRHEAYILQTLLPAIESLYPVVREPQGRLLLGFSKSGWGAFTLLLRNPEVFGGAASWDAPLMLDIPHFGYYGTKAHFGTAENFARYLPKRLLRTRAAHFQSHPRLVLLGGAAFGPEPLNQFREHPHTVAAHELMNELAIPHDYSNSYPAPHEWNLAWLSPAVDRLLALARVFPRG